MTWHDHFTACSNHPDAVAIVTRAAKACKQQVRILEQPYLWSEDFGRFTARYPGALFAIGAGKGTLALHNAAYDFPDTLIPIGLSILRAIVDQELNQ
jgi:metal-dependent amidase/aminoacylase/carboxypeptidase family protein